MRGLSASVLVVLTSALAACTGQGAAPMTTTVCELARFPQRLVAIGAEVRLRSDGQAVISDANCAAVRIELRLIGAAAHAGLEEALKTALAAGVDGVRISVSITGVYTTAPEVSFTAETLTIAPPGR